MNVIVFCLLLYRGKKRTKSMSRVCFYFVGLVFLVVDTELKVLTGLGLDQT